MTERTTEESENSGIPGLALLSISSVTSGKSLNLSGAQLENEGIDHATSEPAWITMIDQRQGSLQANIPVKEPETKNRAGAKAETKEPRYGVGPGTAHKTLQKGAGAN